MDHFRSQQGELYAEDVPLSAVAAAVGTPTYVYARATLERHFRVIDASLAGCAHLVCYAVKANSNLAVLQLFARMGLGFDIVSGGELQRVLAAGGSASKVVFSGVGKTRAEMRRALEVGILCFNVESEAELEVLNEVAISLGQRARISIRVNPNVDAKTHPYISTGLKGNKFGVAHERALSVYQRAASLPGLEVVGIDCHIGSQITTSSPYLDAMDRVDRKSTRLNSSHT